MRINLNNLRFVLFVVGLASMPMVSHGQAYKAAIGYDALFAEFGAALETGVGIRVFQPEAPDGAGSYMPDSSIISEFGGKTFINGTIPPVGTFNGHATAVGTNLYGNLSSIAPGITNVTGADANDYINRILGAGISGTPAPIPQGYHVSNHSYVGNVSPVGIKIDLLRRYDFVINRDNTIAVAGANNGSATATTDIWGHSYNGITVGRSDGEHSRGMTTDYGAGRFKPDIVVPLAGPTSFSTPVVGAAAALLQQAAGFDGFGNANNGGQNEVIKSTLFAGATKEEFGAAWDRNSTRPVDEVFGFGELNIQNSYHIFKGGEFAASTSNPATNVGLLGWDYGNFTGSQLFYDFEIGAGQTLTELSAALVWNAAVTDNPLTGAFDLTHVVANLDLELFDSSGTFMYTVGDFASSLRQSSLSTTYNYEHLYLTNLAAGNYTFRIKGDLATDYGFSWRITTAIPEPSGAIILGLALTASLIRRRRQA